MIILKSFSVPFLFLGIYCLENILGVKFMQRSSGIKWSSLIIGVIFLVIGVFIVSFPEENLFAITWLIGLLFIINGFIEIFIRRIMKKATQRGSKLLIILGIINIMIGLLILFNVVTSTTFIIYLFAIWFIINAIFNIFTPLIAAVIIAIFMCIVFFIIGITYIIDALN